MKRLGVFLLPLDWMLVYRRVTPGIKFAGTHLYARAQTRTARSGVDRTNHEATTRSKCSSEDEKKIVLTLHEGIESKKDEKPFGRVEFLQEFRSE